MVSPSIILTNLGRGVGRVNFEVTTDAPNAAGARRVIVSVESVVDIKITDTVEMARFTMMGFQNKINR